MRQASGPSPPSVARQAAESAARCRVLVEVLKAEPVSGVLTAGA